MKQQHPDQDIRMVKCVLDGYCDCPAKVPAACICNEMPAALYDAKYLRKYTLPDRLREG